jgi:hypothetical protein
MCGAIEVVISSLIHQILTFDDCAVKKKPCQRFFCNVVKFANWRGEPYSPLQTNHSYMGDGGMGGDFAISGR